MCALHQTVYYISDEIKMDEMHEVCRTHGRDKYEILVRKSEETTWKT
jgi:hypothetical protein